MAQVIDFTRYNENIRWTLANGWNIYIWNRMLQDQERKIANEERKLLSTKPGAPKLNPANIGMPIDPEPDHVDDAFYTTDQAREIADRLTERLHEKHPPEQVQFLSTPLGDNYFYNQYIQRLNQREEPTFTWPTPKGVKRDFPDYGANITMADIPSLVEDAKNIVKPVADKCGITDIELDAVLEDCQLGKSGCQAEGNDSGHKKTGCPQHNSKESSQQENSCRTSCEPVTNLPNNHISPFNYLFDDREEE